jgi:hypothetical protein
VSSALPHIVDDDDEEEEEEEEGRDIEANQTHYLAVLVAAAEQVKTNEPFQNN